MNKNVGILHPGDMGVSVAASALHSGHNVFWASKGRSLQTHQRAQSQSLIDASSLEKLCSTCSILICICPPHAAEEVAQQVLAHSFSGIYVDANAISPQKALRIGQMMEEQGISFVDGGIIGGPAWEADKTWLYLSGSDAHRIANCFSAGPLETKVMGGMIGQASALKMCFAAYTKGTTALLCAILATAEELGVLDDLERQWSRNGAGLAEEAPRRVRGVTAKAWRFAGEMEEIAATFTEAGLPGGFHSAAAEIYERLAEFRAQDEIPQLSEVLTALRGGSGKVSTD